MDDVIAGDVALFVAQPDPQPGTRIRPVSLFGKANVALASRQNGRSAVSHVVFERQRNEGRVGSIRVARRSIRRS